MFLAGEKCQVWALRRDTGEPVYLAEGKADAMRATAKQHLRCPHPDCTDEISTRGGKKRDHFFHVNTTPHESGRESEFHLAAKAMLAQWLTDQVPDGAMVAEERSVKDPATALDRRPDVLVTGRTGRRVAFEVEYKSWAVESWEQKQADLEDAGIVTLWLFGHTRVRCAPGTHSGPQEVCVPTIVAEIARRGLPVALINPVTREIGTLIHRTGNGRYDGAERRARLHVDALADCRFSTMIGIRTPSILPIEAAERRRTEIRVHRELLRTKWSAAWEASPLRTVFLERWGEIPPEFGIPARSADEIWQEALPAISAADPHWRGVIYEELVHEKRDDFGWREVEASLRKHGIEFDQRAAGQSIDAWILYLTRLRLIQTRVRDRFRLNVLPFTPTGRALGSAHDDQLEAKRKLAERVAVREEALRRRTEDLEERSRTKMIITPDGKKRWVPK
jgi:hypothetical protein